MSDGIPVKREQRERVKVCKLILCAVPFSIQRQAAEARRRENAVKFVFFRFAFQFGSLFRARCRGKNEETERGKKFASFPVEPIKIEKQT